MTGVEHFLFALFLQAGIGAVLVDFTQRFLKTCFFERVNGLVDLLLNIRLLCSATRQDLI
ncbi:hypothetical protein D3C80_950060 [compost metagenome]